MKNIIEALLIATDTPLSLDRIIDIIKITKEEVKKCIDELNLEYQTANRAFEIKEIAGGFQIYTLPQYARWVGELHKKKEKLSKAALETLAIVAYHQPITRAEVEKTRGVDSSWILDSLMQKGLIKTCGRLQAPGRPIKYATTNEFLRYFGINSINDLPQEELFGESLAPAGSVESSVIRVQESPEKSAEQEALTDMLVDDKTSGDVGEQKETDQKIEQDDELKDL